MTMISDLPQYMVEEILSKVPITCLGAVRCSCKLWNALSRDEILCKSSARHQFLGFLMKEFKICSLRFDLHEVGEEFVDPSVKEIGNLFDQVEISSVFHCDGLLLCVTKEENARRRLVVWNPYLGQTRWIQPVNNYHRLDRYALGFDNKKRNHKILRVLDDEVLYGDPVFAYEIYDFSSNSWRDLGIAPDWDISSYQRGVTLKGNTYFFAKEKVILQGDGEIDEPQDFLLCFDFTRERFGQFLPLPFEHYDNDTGSLSSLRDEKLAALYQNLDMSEVEIWITTKIEPNVVSWIPFLKVDMEPLGFDFIFGLRSSSFFIDEEKKLAVVFDLYAADRTFYTHCHQAAYMIGENGYLGKVDLAEAVNHDVHRVGRKRRKVAQIIIPICSPVVGGSHGAGAGLPISAFVITHVFPLWLLILGFDLFPVSGGVGRRFTADPCDVEGDTTAGWIRVFSPPVAVSLVFHGGFKGSFDVVSLGRSFANATVFQIPNSCFREALPLLVHQGAPRRPGYYNLQLRHEDHDFVGGIIAESSTRWLYANEIIELMRHANLKSLTLSETKPPLKRIGIFIYDIDQYRDNCRWNNSRWRKIEENGETINMTESKAFLDDKFFKRVHRDRNGRFGNLAVVHYRRLP